MSYNSNMNVPNKFIEKLWHRFQSTGSYQAKPHSGGRRRLLAEAEAVIRLLVKDAPDLTISRVS